MHKGRHGRGLLVAMLLLVATGCGSHQPDYAAWEAELSESYSDVDFDAVVDLYENRICKDDDDSLGTTTAVFMDEGALAGLRTNIRYACPDRLSVVDAAVADLEESKAETARICSEGPRDEDEELKAELFC